MTDFLAWCCGIGGLVMLWNQSQHDFADTRRLIVAVGLLVFAVVCTIVEHFVGDDV